jgi:hypothetical protein
VFEGRFNFALFLLSISGCKEVFIIENLDLFAVGLSTSSSTSSIVGCCVVVAFVGDGKSSSVSVTLRNRLSILLSDCKGLIISEFQSPWPKWEDRSGENLDLYDTPPLKGIEGESLFEYDVSSGGAMSIPVLNSMMAPVVSSATMGDLHIEKRDLVEPFVRSIAKSLPGLSSLTIGLFSLFSLVNVAFIIENLGFVVVCSGSVLYV